MSDRGDTGRAALDAVPGGRRALQPDRVRPPAGGGARARLRRRLRGPVALVDRGPRRSSGRRSGRTSSVRASAPYEQVLARPRDAGRPLVRGRRAQLRREPARRQARRSARDPARLGAARASIRSPGASCESGSRARRPPCASGAIEPGDRVVAYVPNLPEAVIAFLAAAAVGAIWSSCSPDFGARSVVDRFAQIEPKLLFCVDGYRYNGRDFDRRDVIAGLLAEMPTVEHTVVIPYLDADPDVSGLRGAIGWEAFLDSGSGHELTFEQVAFDHPLWVLYSSGTTGLPKAIVQGHGGILLEQLKSHHLHVDAQAGDRVFWFTTTGLDDVELPRRHPAHRRLDRALRRQPGPPGHGRALGPRGRRGRHLLRHLGQLRRRLHEGRGRARGRARPCALCARSARPGRRWRPRASAGSTSTSAPTRGCSPPPAGPTSAPPSSAGSRRCRSTPASSRAARSGPRSRPGTRTETRSSTRSASW